MTDGTQECIRLDAQGKVCGSFSCDGEKMIGLPAKGEEGSLFFPVTDTGKRETTVVSYDAEAASFRECAVLPEEAGQLCGTSGQSFFYTAQEKLICWDTESGSREAVLPLADSDISSLTDTLLLLEAENGDIWLYVGTYEKEYVMMLSETSVETEVGLAMLCEGDSDFQSSITRFNQQYPQYQISVKRADTDAESYRTCILAELLNGEGAELLYLSYEDMQSLAKMGALAGIEEYVTKESLDCLLPGAREYGSCEESLVGLLPDIAGVNTLFAAEGTGNGTGWTLEEVMLLAEERDGLEGLFTYPMGDMEIYNVLRTLVGNGIGQSAFLDAEKKESRFAEGNFAAVLEFVKRYTKNVHSGSADGAARIREGEYLAMCYPINMAYTFFSVLAETDGVGYAIGYPTESGSGNYFTADGILVVNRNAENKEAISAFLEYLLSAENQKEFKKSLSVRTDITDVTVQYQEYDGQGIFVWNGQGMLPQKEDGSTYIEEYNAFMQSCVPQKEDSVYFDIIWEEAEGYFDGTRKAEDVVSAIDNRIQLLLDEG